MDSTDIISDLKQAFADARKRYQGKIRAIMDGIKERKIAALRADLKNR